jgi:hypothetical protein
MHQLIEGLERGDLKRLIHPELHIDEFKSKLGRDEDVVVISFKVVGKDPAADLVSFIEKGYTWVIDADVSSGEMDDGDYIVFVEAERNEQIAEHIIEMMEDIMNLTDQDLEDWRVRYYTSHLDQKLELEVLKDMVPDSPESYEAKFGKKDLDSLKSAAGVKVTTKAPKNDYTESLRVAAGIK